MRRLRTRLGLITGLAVVTVVGSACANDQLGTRTTVAPIQPSSYIVRDPVTTTTVPDQTLPVATITDDGRSTVEQSYTIAPGDAVTVIAQRFGITAKELADYNAWPAGIQQAIYPGQTIRIPPLALALTVEGDAQSTAGAPPPQTTTAACIVGVYRLQPGDSPSAVAAKFDVTLAQLNEANRNVSGYANFIVGTEIRIPCS